MNVTVIFRDGTQRKFEDHGRAGGSYSQQVRYVESFVIITDVWGKETAIPTDLVQEVVTDALHRSW
jgi:hypothetical protein